MCLIDGVWEAGAGAVTRVVLRPSNTAEVVAEVREASAEQVDRACAAAARAAVAWRSTPPPERAHVMFRFRELMEAAVGELAELVVHENGKLLSEAKGEVRRGIDMIEYACGAPSLLAGRTLPEISPNVDSYVVREAVGVVAGIPPFNFPAMIPLWMLPLAVVCGNAFILKPAEKCPLTGTRIVELLTAAGLPRGVVSVVHGGKEVSERLIGNAAVAAVSFVGSSPVAASVYAACGAAGKRVQALGGAKNHLVVMPDADLKRTVPALLGSCFGCAGQRCLAGSVVVPVGTKERCDAVVAAFVEGARGLRMGDGLDPAATLCPVQCKEARDRVVGWIDRGVREGATLLLDGRTAPPAELAAGCFVGATIFDDAYPDRHAIAREEVFGPVVTIMRAPTLDAAITAANSSRFGNSASIFTADGAAVRTFRARIQCGMLGVNLGVPAPMAMFSFGGWKESIYSSLAAHGPDAVEFYTRKKVVTERWFGAEAPRDGWV